MFCTVSRAQRSTAAATALSDYSVQCVNGLHCATEKHLCRCRASGLAGRGMAPGTVTIDAHQICGNSCVFARQKLHMQAVIDHGSLKAIEGVHQHPIGDFINVAPCTMRVIRHGHASGR
jgi:hypothetical protein